MARTTDALVRGVIDISASLDLTPFILAANELVTELCVDSDYTDARLEIIERWLAAHFAGVFEQQPAAERAGAVSINYQYSIGLYLKQTKQGQMALNLDTDGNLAALCEKMEKGGKRTGSVTWLGSNEDDEWWDGETST